MSKKNVIVSAAIIAVIAACVLFWDIMKMILASAAIAYLLFPLVRMFERRTKMKRGFAIVSAFIVAVAAVFLLSLTLVPVLGYQIETIIDNMPVYNEKAIEYLQKAEQFLNGFGIKANMINLMQGFISQNSDALGQTLANVVSSVAGMVAKLSGIIVNAFFVLMAAVYFMIDAEKIVNGFVNLFSGQAKLIVQEIIVESDKMFWSYLKVKTILAAGGAVVTFIGLLIIGVDNALLFAVITFLFDYIPYVGSIAAGVLPTLYALLSDGWLSALITAIFIIIVQQIQSNIIAPKVQADSVGVHPITGIFSLIACTQLLGGFGMIFALPIAGFVQIVIVRIRKYYKQL